MLWALSNDICLYGRRSVLCSDHQIATVYDHDGTSSHLIYQNKKDLFPDVLTSWTCGVVNDGSNVFRTFTLTDSYQSVSGTNGNIYGKVSVSKTAIVFDTTQSTVGGNWVIAYAGPVDLSGFDQLTVTTRKTSQFGGSWVSIACGIYNAAPGAVIVPSGSVKGQTLSGGIIFHIRGKRNRFCPNSRPPVSGTGGRYRIYRAAGMNTLSAGRR